ncbi:sentrin-specific protease isoform X2 [Fopius arisanus]|uniref:Sentrin-specific protease isoform X2 n=1 Tax=Fopius arisanus TaxID=64838 RepID=A0A9R1TXG0_9HYME|nr:PREDICTED: sentrin-specific protease-like isoform X2 [Fopius arisanus]
MVHKNYQIYNPERVIHISDKQRKKTGRQTIGCFRLNTAPWLGKNVLESPENRKWIGTSIKIIDWKAKRPEWTTRPPSIFYVMLNWKTIIKMIFTVLRRFLGWCDEGSRKRHASDADFTDHDHVNPKKQRRVDSSLHNHRDIIEIEDDPNDIQICEDSFHSLHNNSYNSIRKRNSLINRRGANCTSSRKNLHIMNSYPVKSRLNSKSQMPQRLSVLERINHLRDKENYSRLLQGRNPRIQLIPATPEIRRHQSPIEVKFLPSSSRCCTPISRLPRTSDVVPGRSIEVDDCDDTLSQSSKSKCEMKKPLINRESIATNSLRDRLSGKAVMKGDFIPRVAERYNERIEKRSKEAQELERMKSILSKHNRLQREVALEEQLARSMRLYEAVLEEQEDEEQLPELSSEMMSDVQRALVPRPSEDVLAEGFGLRITRKDIHTLSGLNWLNDEVINFYMNLLIERGKEEKYPNVYAMNTFFYPKLLSGGHAVLKRWTRKVDIFAQDIIVVPVHLQMHWCMSIIDFRDSSIRYYDSMGGENHKCLRALRKYLENESLDKKKKSFDTSEWTVECMSDIPQQMNGSDCGVFSCTFAEFICANRRITFTQDDMPYFRHKMVYEILKRKLL